MTLVPSLLKTWILQTISGMYKISWNVTEINYNYTKSILKELLQNLLNIKLLLKR